VNREYTEVSNLYILILLKTNKKVEPMKTMYWTGAIQQAT